MKPHEARDPELDPELAEIARLLEEAGRVEERDLREAAHVTDAPGLARFDDTVDGLWREVDRRRSRARWTGFATAAAALALVVFLVRGRDADGGGPGGELLGDGLLRILRPVGSVPAWGVIEWSGPGGPYRLRVLAADTRATVLGPIRVVEQRYEPSGEETAGWPAAVVIEVECRLPDGTPERTSAEAVLAR